MSPDPHDELLQRDWATLWDTLAEAPPLVPRPPSAQITLRLPAGQRARIRRVAAARGLPYHALARSWIIDGLREPSEPPQPAEAGPQPEQMNVKLDQELLDRLKLRAHELSRPYHALARELIEHELTREEHTLGFQAPPPDPAIKDLMVLLLHARNAHGQDAVRGITRMQKLLFVLEQTLAPNAGSFYAHNYGPFSEGVGDAAQALRLAGFLSGSEPAAKGPPTYEEMLVTAKRSPAQESQGEPAQEFALNRAGHDAAERLRHSDPAYERLFEEVTRVREQWDTPDLLERVYDAWPQYTERSLIRDEVAARRRKRRAR